MTRRYDRRTFLQYASSASATAVAASLAGCTSGATGGGSGGSSSGGDGENTVKMNNNLDYVPRKLTVSVGDTVTWKNAGAVAHSVTAYGEKIPTDGDYFASGGFNTEEAALSGWKDGLRGALKKGDTYSHTFEVPGPYQYYCIPHEMSNMVGTIKVTK